MDGMADRFVLTAAHCVNGRTPYNVEVLLNADRGVVGEEGFAPDRYSVSTILLHPNYTASLDYDAALLRLNRPVDLRTTAPICLPRPPPPPVTTNDYAGVVGTVTGWGYTMEDGELSAILRKASVLVMSNDECR